MFNKFHFFFRCFILFMCIHTHVYMFIYYLFMYIYIYIYFSNCVFFLISCLIIVMCTLSFLLLNVHFI